MGYKDQEGPSTPNGAGWSACLAYGTELRFLGVGFPTGFEWHLILLEFMLFSLIWRFNGSIFWAGTAAFALNRSVLTIYSKLIKVQLAHTAIINPMFLI